MTSLSSNLVNSLAEGIHKVKCIYGHDGKKCETFGLNTKIVIVFFNTKTLEII